MARLPEKEKEKTLEAVLTDLRRLYDHISENYGQLKNRVLALIAGEVAIVGFIFSGQGLSIVDMVGAEKVFWHIGVTGLLVAFGLLLWIVSTADWLIPLDISITSKLYSRFESKLEYLEHIKEDHEECVIHCLKKLKVRANVFNKTLFVLSSAIIILLVLKFTR